MSIFKNHKGFRNLTCKRFRFPDDNAFFHTWMAIKNIFYFSREDTVPFVLDGVLQPINPDGSSVFKFGRTVPVKLQLTDASGAYVTDATVRIYLAKISDGVIGTEVEASSTSAASTGNTFRYDPEANQYIFNLGTRDLSKGTWQARIEVSDGASYFVVFSLK